MAPPAEVLSAAAAADADEVTAPAPAQRANKAKKKAKAKGKAKAKAKSKAKGKAKAKKMMMLADGDTAGEGAADKAPKAPKASGLRKKLLEQLKVEGRTVEEALAAAKKEIHGGDAKVQEAEATEKAHQAQEDEARTEFEATQKEVLAGIDGEHAAAEAYRAVVTKRDEARTVVTGKRQELLDAQKGLAMLEVMSMNHARMKELEERRKAASDAADQARKHLAEQRQREKEALEATKRLLEEARNMKGKGAGKKRASDAVQASPSKRAAAAVPEGEDIE